MRWVLEAAAPRLDRFLVERAPEIPRARWEAWIRAGEVRVNGEAATKPGTRLRAGDTVEAGMPEAAMPAVHLLPEPLDLPTLFEDDRLWIVDKPAGMVVHPGPGHPGGTVLNALLHRINLDPAESDNHPPRFDNLPDDEDSASPYPGLVHRLDRFTTGCLLMAKDEAARTALQAQFKDRTVDKRYLAVARDGRKLPELGSLLVDAPIARHRLDRLRMVVSASGRPSQTRVRVMARSRGLALVECELLTGRTHQIRVHLQHLGAPILGDPLYGGPSSWMDVDRRPFPLDHPLLHAWTLALDHPTDGRRVMIEAPLHEPFRAALRAFGLPEPG